MSEPVLTLDEALLRLDAAVPDLFAADPTVRAVGLEPLPDGRFGLLVTRCGDVIRPLSRPAAALPAMAAGLPVRQRLASRSPTMLARIPIQLGQGGGSGGPGPGQVLERRLTRPVPWGAEVQNYDADHRAGHLANGTACVGTLGCVVRLHDGTPALLSNNHVLADENHGLPGHDRVLQCASLQYAPAHEVARLGAFAPIVPWYGPGTVPPAQAMNRIDAALAPLHPGTAWQHAYLAQHCLPVAQSIGFAMRGDRVHKVGRTTGATTGVVTQIGITLGPMAYQDGPSYFQRVFAVESDGGQPFAGHGDSGSAIVRSDGALVGLLFAGDDLTTYACDAQSVFTALGCQLA